MNKSEAGRIGAAKAKPIQAQKHLAFVDGYYKQPRICKHCERVIVFEKRTNDFCSYTCSAKYNNLRRIGKVTEPHLCQGCNNATTAFVYCSHKCQNKHRHDLFIQAWLNGSKDAATCNGMTVSAHVKRWLREQRENKCENCGWCERNPVTGKVPLQVDHKDGNAENNDPSNLRLLCPNCHSLTPTFGGLNRGKGRKLRYALKV